MLLPPNRRCGAYPHRVRQAVFREPIAQPRFITIAGIHEHRTARDPRSQRRFDLRPGQLAFGGKSDLFGHACKRASRFVFGPLLRQIQPIVQRHTALGGGARAAHAACLAAAEPRFVVLYRRDLLAIEAASSTPPKILAEQPRLRLSLRHLVSGVPATDSDPLLVVTNRP